MQAAASCVSFRQIVLLFVLSDSESDGLATLIDLVG